MYSLKKAADVAGKGKPAILKAIQKGRISANKNALGEWEIDPAELHRVYPPVSGNGSEKREIERQETQKEAVETVHLNREINLLREQLQDLKNDRDHWRQQAERMSLMLTDQRPQSPARSWWPWGRKE